jgi:hypothetical protein
MNEKPEALRLADEIHREFGCRAVDAAAELRRQHAEIERLREALAAALDNGCRTVYLNEDDDVGCRGCCDEVSYLPHSHDCWTVKARAAIDAAMEDV